MGKDHQDIVQILAKFSIGEELSPIELEHLEVWRNASSENQNLLLEIVDEETRKKHLNLLRAIDVDDDWEQFSFRLANNKQKKRQIYQKVVFYAAAIILLFLLYKVDYTVFMPHRKANLTAQETKEGVDQQAFNKTVQLILADGTRVSLDGSKISDINKGSNFKVSGQEVIFLPEGIGQESAGRLPQVLEVPKGSFYAIVLSDGTKVWVNSNSKLTFPVQFDDRSRRVKLEGEGYFEVAHDVDRPFYVESRGVQVKVLGTHFNVNGYNQYVKTTLASGKVELRANNQQVLLSPGYSGEWNGSILRVEKADLEKELAWKKEEFCFKEDNIVKIAQDLSRWYDIEVKFSGDIDLQKRYSGTMSRKLTLEKLLEVLTFGSDFEFDIKGKQLSIKQHHD